MITLIVIVVALIVGIVWWYLYNQHKKLSDGVSGITTSITTSTTTFTTTAIPRIIPVVNVNLQPAYGVVIDSIEGLQGQTTQTWPIGSPVSYKALYLSNELFVTISKVPVQSLGLIASVNGVLQSTVHVN